MKGVEDPRLDPSHGACAHPAWAAGFGGADGLPGEPWYVARGFLVVERVVVAVGGVDVSSTRMARKLEPLRSCFLYLRTVFS